MSALQQWVSSALKLSALGNGVVGLVGIGVGAVVGAIRVGAMGVFRQRSLTLFARAVGRWSCRRLWQWLLLAVGSTGVATTCSCGEEAVSDIAINLAAVWVTAMVYVKVGAVIVAAVDA